MALIDILGQVNTTLTYWYAQQSPSQNLYTDIGRSGVVGQSKSPPAVIWVPTSDTYEGVQVYAGPRAAQTLGRILRTRVLGVDAWLWAAVAPGFTEDFAQLDTLINATIGAVHANLLGAYRVLAGTYQGMEDTELAAYGRCYVLRFSLLVPVTEMTLPPTTQVVTSLPQAVQIGFPDGTTGTGP